MRPVLSSRVDDVVLPPGPPSLLQRRHRTRRRFLQTRHPRRPRPHPTGPGNPPPRAAAPLGHPPPQCTPAPQPRRTLARPSLLQPSERLLVAKTPTRNFPLDFRPRGVHTPNEMGNARSPLPRQSLALRRGRLAPLSAPDHRLPQTTTVTQFRRSKTLINKFSAPHFQYPLS